MILPALPPIWNRPDTSVGFYDVFRDWIAANFLDAKDGGIYGYGGLAVAVRERRVMNDFTELHRAGGAVWHGLYRDWPGFGRAAVAFPLCRRGGKCFAAGGSGR